jgi:CHAT domain-containing protein
MSRFYSNVAALERDNKRVSFADALAEAENWVRQYRDAKGGHPFAHPVYWSGFTLIGDAN